MNKFSINLYNAQNKYKLKATFRFSFSEPETHSLIHSLTHSIKTLLELSYKRALVVFTLLLLTLSLCFYFYTVVMYSVENPLTSDLVSNISLFSLFIIFSSTLYTRSVYIFNQKTLFMRIGHAANSLSFARNIPSSI